MTLRNNRDQRRGATATLAERLRFLRAASANQDFDIGVVTQQLAKPPTEDAVAAEDQYSH